MPQKKRILVMAENHLEADQYLRSVLEQAGYEVEFTDKPKVVLKHLSKKKWTFAAVIMDIMIYHGTELDVLETIEGVLTGVVLYNNLHRQHPTVPAILLKETAHYIFDRIKNAPNLLILPRVGTPPTEICQYIDKMISATVSKK
jgi:DNA-binding NtrC family response regulator